MESANIHTDFLSFSDWTSTDQAKQEAIKSGEYMSISTLHPRGILFLCVNNSARSQMAEGIARALMPPEVQVWSAGSNPTKVRPEAIAVLQEIGIDISNHRSKSIDEIPASEVDTVITLCAEEVCPVFFGHVLRLHWALPDPAAIAELEEERLSAFRKTRDELHRRISALVEDHSKGGVINGKE